MSYDYKPESSESPPHTPLLPPSRTSSQPPIFQPYNPPHHQSSFPESSEPVNRHTTSYLLGPGLRRPVTRTKMGLSVMVVSSYVADWLVVIALAIGCYLMNDLKPNARPFALDDPTISFPYFENETVPPKILLLCNSALPIIIILIVCVVFVPGRTVPKGTPSRLVWKRRLWELHQAWLGLALSLLLAFFVTNGLKNLEGRPRPDALSRCNPDLANVADHYAGGFRLPVEDPATTYYKGHLVKWTICQQTDESKLWDGFRSFPSGHSSSSAAGLLYLSLFLASKFAVTIPYLSPSAFDDPTTAYHAFPSRTSRVTGSSDLPNHMPATAKRETSSSDPTAPGSGTRDPNDDSIELIAPYPGPRRTMTGHDRVVTAARMQAASPPLYLLLLCLIPTFTAIFIAASRWMNFRHHSTDIATGFTLGTITAVFSFRYYHCPFLTVVVGLGVLEAGIRLSGLV